MEASATFKEDAAHRDFTLNAMALDSAGNLLDPFGGQADIEARLIRCVGDPRQRMAEDPLRADRTRISPNLTWYPTEFSKLRLQYNLDDRQDLGVDHSVWLQFEFILGAHAAHKF